ncbi:phospholipase D-like domain-containing protein [Microvirga soli]|uniref:phospholipase D-like domain-containing protein n=1 Tax=Microvirga soli TaxID=1854496 RepID=UPI00191D6A3E|nr:phospholipase D-like domain-containing protein [Microvirga soli]
MEKPIVEPGETCWRMAKAGRLALIIDAASYFASLRRAMIHAKRSIYLIGWDFDTRIRLDPSVEDEWPLKLGHLLNVLVKARPELEVRVLKWDVGVLQTLGRGATPLFILNWMASRRVHFRLDHVHPADACHHQKLAVIDDVLAFCGGIDITVGRWDTREHCEQDPRRTSPWGFTQPPWHDATAAVDGEAASALGDLARERWKHATGEDLAPPGFADEIWPETLPPTLMDVEVGIARTQPAYDGQPEAREIEALNLRAIGSAQDVIYIESQYLASHTIGEALAARLEQNGGPEVIIVAPLTAEGWLEEEAMGTARALIVRRLRGADRESRLRLLYPANASGTPIYVHAKIMIVDDRFLRVGSSNLNNRSMGLDTECDIAVEVRPGARNEEASRAAIRTARNDLLAEHSGVAIELVNALQDEGRSPIQIIDLLSRPYGRSLHRLPLLHLNAVEEKIAASHLLDPEKPDTFQRKLRRFLAWAIPRAHVRGD